jgi:hypothetical protein
MRASFSLSAAAPMLAVAATFGGCSGMILDPSGEPPRTSEVASESGALRLTQVEIDNTLRDLLGDDTRPASRFLISDQYTPYDNDITLQEPSEALVISLEIMAADVADRLVADPERLELLVPCEPAGPSDVECLREFVEEWVPRALRRPLEPGEADDFLSLHPFATEDNPSVENDFYTAVNLIVRAVVQHPELLYRIEIGTPTVHRGVLALDDWEVASRLSYLLWATMPDDALRADAAAGRLTGADGRRAAAERMMVDDRAKAQMRRFHAMWLGHRVLPQSAELVSAFSRETGALLDRVVFDDPQSYFSLFTMRETWVDDFLADHYGMPRPPGGEGWVAYTDPRRAGILSHGSVLASFAKFADTSPTQRGILIRERLMCDKIEPPPPTIDVDAPPGDAEALCKYDRYAEHREAPGCAACHAGMDPIGFGLENYDMQGRYREHDDGLPECIIEGEGALPGSLGTFTGPAELAALLVDSGHIERCAMQQFYQFAIGREVDGIEQPVVEELVDGFREAGHDLKAFLLDFVSSDRFALRRERRLP